MSFNKGRQMGVANFSKMVHVNAIGVSYGRIFQNKSG